MVWDGEILLPCKNRQELREWLLANSSTENSCWIFCSVKLQADTILYLDAVEEALCVGWIDGVKKKAGDGRTVQRLSPRAKKSNWTELNKERVRRLERLGLMTEAGRKCLPDMSKEACQIHPDIKKALEEDPEVYHNFLGFPGKYRRIRIDTIQSALLVYNQPDIFKNRLEKFILKTKENQMFGQWHDDGRLLDDKLI